MLIKDPADIPPGSIVLALAFLNLGPANPAQPFGRLIPGAANRQIAAALEANAERFVAVLTQQAVSDALTDSTQLADGTPVFQMHRHCEIPVFTFAALSCAFERLPPGDWPLVVIAHPRHLRRARLDAQALCNGRQMYYLPSGPVCYADGHWSRALHWTIKNALGWLIDGMLVAARRWVWAERLFGLPLTWIQANGHCPQQVALGPLPLASKIA